MNPNLLFPRLSIRTKLAIAFAGIALVPSVVVTWLGVRHTVRQARTFAMTTLEHDVAEARAQTQQLLRGVETDLSYIGDHLLGPRLRRGWGSSDGPEIMGTAGLLELKVLHFQIKAIGPDGELLAVIDADGAREVTDRSDEGVYYGLRAQSLADGEHDIFPVEVRDATGSSGTRPVVAIVEAVRDPDGVFLGAVVSEVSAAGLFARLDDASPNLKGVTGLVDAQGLLLYHSERKADWTRLLANRPSLDLELELTSAATDSILAASREHSLVLRGDRIVTYAPMSLLGDESARLVVYRILPASVLDSEVRRFVRLTLLAGLGLVAAVALLAILASHQFTQPIYRLREAARRLAAGGALEKPLDIETRDELEDLANDFTTMAEALAERRRGLEDLVEDRTRALGEASAELAGILHHSADAIVGLDPEGRVRLWNDGARTLFEYEAREAVGEHIDGLILPEGAQWQRESDFIRSEMADRGVLSNYQTRRVTRSGEAFAVSLTQTAIRDDGGALFGFSLIIRDTTQQTRLEEQMRRSERLAALSVMAGGLAHELGNPLAVIQNRIECMQQELHSQDHAETLEGDLEVLSQHANRLHGLIGDFLHFARDEHDEVAAVDLGAVVSRVSTLLARTFRTRGVALELDPDVGAPTVPGNENAVETVIMNLLLNALDATPAGGEVTVRVGAAPDGEAVLVEVSDTGCGIPPEIRHQIFEPFFTTKEPGRGTGLGLAVCAAVLQRHGGGIEVESGPGRGATFTLHFPTTRDEFQWLTAESS